MATRAHPLVFGVVVFLASESMLFAGLLAAWFDLRALNAAWPPAGVRLDPRDATIGTGLLVAGSALMTLAQRAIARERIPRARALLLGGVACAVGFSALALREWATVPFRVSSHAYGTLFFVLTGAHLAHVLAGAVLLTALVVFLRRPAFAADGRAGVEAIAYYWHFLLIVWLAVWGAVYELH